MLNIDWFNIENVEKNMLNHEEMMKKTSSSSLSFHIFIHAYLLTSSSLYLLTYIFYRIYFAFTYMYFCIWTYMYRWYPCAHWKQAFQQVAIQKLFPFSIWQAWWIFFFTTAYTLDISMYTNMDIYIRKIHRILLQVQKWLVKSLAYNAAILKQMFLYRSCVTVKV